MDTTVPGPDQPAADTAVPAYPIPRPVTGDDPRFCFGLTWEVAKVLHQYGYPAVRTGADVARIQQALFTLIYQEESR